MLKNNDIAMYTGHEISINRQALNRGKYSTSIAKLCSQDSIKVVSPGSAPTSTCPLGEFLRFKTEGTIDDAQKLLTDGAVLKELVEEDAFKEAFPEEKEKK